MKPFLSMVLCGIVAGSARAQPPVLAPQTPAQEAQKRAAIVARREASKASKLVPEGSGFYYLLLAAEAIDDSQNLTPELPENFTQAQFAEFRRIDIIRAKKQLESHSAQALQLLRIALQKGVVRPTVNGKPFLLNDGIHNYPAYFRQLMRALTKESEVRLAAGDARGALESRLDAIDLGVSISDGTYIDMMTGTAIQSAGRTKIEPIVAGLDVASCRAAAVRLAQIEAKRPPFSTNFRVEADSFFETTWKWLSSDAVRQALASPERRFQFGLTDKGISEAQAREVLALTPETLRQTIDRLNGGLTSTEMPFQKAKLVPVADESAFRDVVGIWAHKTIGFRFNYERAALQNRLWKSALELHAIKLETGAYPLEYNAGIDPFSFPLQPLIYESDGATYRLYSVGPDGEDNGGAAPHTVITDGQTGAKTVVSGLDADTTGDISAPIF